MQHYVIVSAYMRHPEGCTVAALSHIELTHNQSTPPNDWHLWFDNEHAILAIEACCTNAVYDCSLPMYMTVAYLLDWIGMVRISLLHGV